MSTEKVNHPPHYNTGSLEVIEILQDQMSKEEFAGFLRGNILKYLLRAPHKGGAEDLRKAQWYLDRLIQEGN